MKALERIDEALRTALRFGILAALGAGPACGGETKRAHPTGGEGAGMAGTEAAPGSAGNQSGGSAGKQSGGSVGNQSGGSAGNQSGGSVGAGIGGTASDAGSGGSTVASGGVGKAGAAAGDTFGGFAGAPIELTDPELCEAACTELDEAFELPGALCEDWRVLDDRYELAFCQKPEATGCGARCTERLSRVPEACRDALRAGIPCVASDGFYKNHSAEFCYLQMCHRPLLRISAECNGLREELAAARARWNDTVGNADYSFWYESEPMRVKIEVSAGVPTVVEGTLASPPSIDDLFARVEQQLDDGSPFRLVEYDGTFGHPFRADSLRLAACGGFISQGFAVSELELQPK